MQNAPCRKLLVCFISLVSHNDNRFSHLSWIRVEDTITLNHCFSQSLMSCVFFEMRQKEKREVKNKKIKKNRQEGKNNFLLKSRVTLCWWTCGAHQDEKELPQLWNPPVKINILFKPLSGKGRGEMRESKRERERKRARRKRKRHRCGGGGGGGCCC